ncbi:MAG: amidase [Frankiales bacterium]|nr:amidase [Frankiales bacterium]
MDGFSLRLDHGPGLRVAVKDLFDMEGLPTTAGSAAVQAAPASRDAACLAGIRASAVVVGRTAMHELAYGITGINAWQGTPTNPLDASWLPGGSSSGSAVVVANDQADVGIGSDTGGSVRIPAACCGVAGLKTTWGRISLHGVWPLAPSLDTVGPLARDVAGLVVGMQLLEPGFTVGAPGRIGRWRPDAAPGVDAALDALLGRCAEVALPGWEQADAAAAVLLSAEAHRGVGHLLASGRIGTDVAQRLTTGGNRTSSELAAAQAVRQAWTAEIAAALERVDVIALPVLRDAPAPLDAPERMYSLRLTLPVNLAGLPAVAMPVPRRDGPPASLQLIGRPGSEEQLLATALELESSLA